MLLKVISLTEQWIEILMAPNRHDLTVTEVCQRYGISRETFYLQRRRYRADGLAGLEPRSRRPKTSPRQTPEQVEDQVVALRMRRCQRTREAPGGRTAGSGSAVMSSPGPRS